MFSDALNILPSTPILCDDHLTEKNKRLLMAAKTLKQSGKVKYVWTRNGKVKMREADDGPIISIQDESQLEDWYYKSAAMEVQEAFNRASNQNSRAVKRTADERSSLELNRQREPNNFKKPKKFGVQSSIKSFASSNPYRGDSNVSNGNININFQNRVKYKSANGRLTPNRNLQPK